MVVRNLFWDSSMEVGDGPIDADHRRLVGVLEGLYAAAHAGVAPSVLAGSVSELERYAVEHFRREEGLMRDAGYPAIDAHSAQHRFFTGRVRSLRDSLGEGTGSELAVETIVFLHEWIRTHVLGSDHSFRPYLPPRP